MSRIIAAIHISALVVVLSPILLAACSPDTPPSLAGIGASGAVNLTVDGSQRYQTIDGFGVNANSLPWDNGRLAPALDQLTTTFGASVWRVIVESTQGWEDAPAPGDATTYDWAYYDKLYETPKFQALWGVLGYLQQKRVPTIMLNVMGCAPDWMGGCAINPTDEDYYVRMETSLLYYARNVKHLRIDIFSPMNEEDHGDPEGPRVTSAQYVRILNKLSTRLDGLGLGDIKLLGPDTASAGAATSDYIPALLTDPGLMAKITHFGLHDYGGNSGNAASVIASSAYPDRTFWMTEYSAWCGGCDNGAPNPNDWSFATGTLDYLFNSIEQGASSALVYDGYDSYYEHHGSMGYWGLLAYDATTKTYTPRKRFYTLAQVARFARPGMVRIGATSQDDSVRVFAFTDPATGALTIVGRNSSNSAENLRGTLANLRTPASLALYQTTQALDMARGADVPVTGGSFTAQVAPDSVFTLTSLPPVPAVGHAAAPTPAPTATPRASAGPLTLGNTSVGTATDSGDANYLNGSRFTTGTTAGAVTSMSVHVGSVSPSPNDQYELAIYTDANGSPGTLVAHSESGTLTPNAWNTLPVRATLRPNTGYWLMYNTNGNSDAANNMHYAASAAVPEAYSASPSPFGSWPESFGRAVVSTGSFSIYATFATTTGDTASATGTAASAQTTSTPVMLMVSIIIVVAVLLMGAYWLSRRSGWTWRLPRRS